MKSLVAIFAFLFAAGAVAHTGVVIVEPKDGAVVTNPVKVKMDLHKLKLCEANKETKNKKCGHFHLIVDGPAIPKGQPIPKDATHLHYGKMEKEAELTLPPGKHTITLQFADYAHISAGENMTATVGVEVK
jgi:hypothetical protein